MQHWIPICNISEIPTLGSRRLERTKGLEVAIFKNAQQEVFALLDFCPHKGGPLSQGIVYGKHVSCPLHNWSIDLNSGQAQAPDTGCTVSFAIKVDHDVVHLDENELKTKGLTQVRPRAGPQSVK
jgi:nitrite reductase (NADH) small subunit